jgi:bifunctional enzyme CysN/CysC
MTDMLKFITCGSVDDGKSTLIGHLLYDAKLLFTDHKKALEIDSKLGSRDGALDYSLLLDGLMAEREQGITIDVAYRYFNTENRSFIVADCPGHEQYTRNMAVGASFADLAVVLADATKGLLTQTRRHVRICALMGIKHYVLAVNKIDLISYNKDIFNEIKEEFLSLVNGVGATSVYVLPVCATDGDNITNPSQNTPWHKGLPLLSYLEQVDVTKKVDESEGFILPIQRVCRPNHTYRGFQGQIEHGKISVGDEVIVLPGNEKSNVKSIYITDSQSDTAYAGQAVTIQLNSEVDASRGNVLARDTKPEVSSAFTASLLWMDGEELVTGRNYLLKCGTKTISAVVMSIKYKIDINTGKYIAANKLKKNELAMCDISLSENIVFDALEKSKALGGFILINRISNMTSACGAIQHGLRRSTNVVWKDTDVTPPMRAELMAQKPLTLWFTGLSGAGKTVIANALEKRLFELGIHTMILDGDNIRHGLNKNLGFIESDRVENIRRVAEVSKLMNDAGLVVLASLISPYESDRENASDIIGEPFKLIYISTPLEVCESRDTKGLYAKARRGEIPNFTGVTDVYDKPAECALEIDTSDGTVDEAVELIIRRFFEK